MKYGMSKRRPKLPPIATWTCPHCGHVHTTATLTRLDSGTIQCQGCRRPFPGFQSRSSGSKTQIERLLIQAERYPLIAAQPSRATSNSTEVADTLIREHPSNVIEDGTTYAVWVCGAERTGGTWEGWLEFHPANVSQPFLRTGQETSQPNQSALKYWADGLEPIYLVGALARAQGRLL